MGNGRGKEASSGQQAKSERRILTPHVAHRDQGQAGGRTRWILATFTSRRRLSLPLLRSPPLPTPSSPSCCCCRLWLRLSGRQACKLFLLNRCGHKRTCCLPQPYQLLPLATCFCLSPPLFLDRSSFDICSGCGGALLVIAVWAPLLLSCQSSEACAKLLLVVNLLLPLLANLVGQADMQMLLPLPLPLLRLLLPLSNVACLLFFMQIFELFFSLILLLTNCLLDLMTERSTASRQVRLYA